MHCINTIVRDCNEGKKQGLMYTSLFSLHLSTMCILCLFSMVCNKESVTPLHVFHFMQRVIIVDNISLIFCRPCAMVVPDFELIAEIMLVAEGFLEARLLARKFLTLYTLCKELLSKQDHYDWGLRAIKSVLVVAGALKRGDKGRPEDQVIFVL